MTTRHKLGLLLPLVPLAAIGIAELVDTIGGSAEQPTICVVSEPAPIAPPRVAPPPAPVLTPGPTPTVSF